MCVCMYVCMWVCMCVNVHECMNVCVCVYEWLCMSVCECMCMSVCICVCVWDLHLHRHPPIPHKDLHEKTEHGTAMLNCSFLLTVAHNETVSWFADARGELRRAGVLKSCTFSLHLRPLCLHAIGGQECGPRSLQLDIGPGCSSFLAPTW